MKHDKKIALFPIIFIFYEIAVYLSNDMYLPSMPAIAKELFLSQEQVQYTLTFWFLGASSLQFILGPISDRFGRRKVIIIGAIFFCLGSSVCATANNFYLLIAARFIQGTAICSALVAGYAAIHELFDTKTAIKIFAFMNAVTILAPSFGPLAGAMIAEFANWRYIFWILFAMGLISLMLLYMFMPESNQQKHSLNLKRIFSSYKEILSNKDFLIPTFAYAFLVGIFFVWMFESPFVMIERYNKSSLYYGLAQTLIFSFYFVGAVLTKWMINNFSMKSLIANAVVLTILGNITFMISAYKYDSMIVGIISMVLISLGTSLLFGPLNRVAIESTKQPMGSRTAVFSTIVSAFGALTGWLLTLVRVENLFVMSQAIAFCTLVAAALITLTKISLLD